MNRNLKAALFCSAVALHACSSVCAALAQTAVTPAPDPTIGSTPNAPDGATETYDQVAIQQLMKIVELSRLVGGGISQIFASLEYQKQALDQIRDGQTGTRNIPTNGSAETDQRAGGPGLKEMADGALDGAEVGPSDVVEALDAFKATYGLDRAFALKNDKSVSKMLLAQASAEGAIAASTAESSYKRANASMDRLDSYITALQSSPDLKTSIDLNTRVMIEVAQQINESLRTQSALTSTAGTYFMVLASEVSKKDNLSGLKNFNR